MSCWRRAVTGRHVNDGSIAEPNDKFNLSTCLARSPTWWTQPPPSPNCGAAWRLATGDWLLLLEPIVAMNLEQPEHAGLGR